MAGYSGTPLVKKIGIKPGHRLLFVNAPKDFAATLGELPEGAGTVTKGRPFDVGIVFVKSAADLQQRVSEVQSQMSQDGMLWAAWPKKTSGVTTDLVEDKVRDFGLATGLVDVKVCAIDETWSGLKFVIRLADRVKTPKATTARADVKKAAAK
jgi:hypothetical protein